MSSTGVSGVLRFTHPLLFALAVGSPPYTAMSSDADLKKQLDDALARIAELEEENAGLRAEMGIRLEEADKRREELQKKREELLVQVEQEEEYLTNTLQGKLREVWAA